MGTRSLTILKGRSNEEIAVLYRQFDGYTKGGHGQELAEFLSGFEMVNGMTGDEGPKFANGPDCLAAQIIAHFKQQPGQFYLHPAGTRDIGEEYTYTVSCEVGQEPHISVESGLSWDGYDGAASDVLAKIMAE